MSERKGNSVMDRRRLLLILAVFVAVIGTALVFLYVQSADNRAGNQYDSVSVLKATQNIAAGESYDAALSAGKISLQPVPQNQLNAGYQIDTTALKGKFTSVPIFAGQQVISSQFGDAVQAAATTLPIPKGMIAISVNLTDPDRVAGNVQNGSNVAIFVTGQLTATAGGASAGGDTQSTRLLLPNVTVLNVGSPQPPATSTDGSDGARRDHGEPSAHAADAGRHPEGGAEGDLGLQGPRPHLRAPDDQQQGRSGSRNLDRQPVPVRQVS